MDGTRVDADYLDNLDFFLASVPMKWDGFRITPWAMYGLRGRNAFNGLNGFNGGHEWSLSDIGHPQFTYFPYLGISGMEHIDLNNKPWGSMIWLGLPLTLTAFDD